MCTVIFLRVNEITCTACFLGLTGNSGKLQIESSNDTSLN